MNWLGIIIPSPTNNIENMIDKDLILFIV